MPGIQRRKESAMKEYHLTRAVKDELTKLAVACGAAYSAVVRATKNPKFSVSPEELAKLNQTKQETSASLVKAVSPLGLEESKELAGWIQYKSSHDPVKPMGKGQTAWDKVTANELINGLKSLVNALRTAHGNSDDRVRQTNNRARTAELFVKACNETGICPRGGLNRDSRDFQLRELDRRFTEAQAKGEKERAEYLNNLYGRIKSDRGMTNLDNERKPAEVELPEGVTVDADTSKGIATMGETLQPVDAAPVAAAEPKASETEQLREKAFGGKKPRFQKSRK